MSNISVKGLILMGGQSSRMGTDKAFVDWKGKTLLQHAINNLEQVVPDIYLSVNQQQHEALKDTYQCLPDNYIDKGPMGGILSALEQLESNLVVVAIDMPLINEVILQKIYNAGEKADQVTACKGALDRWQPIPSFWPKQSAESLKAIFLVNELSLTSYLDIHAKVLEEEVDLNQFININRPEQLR